MLQSSRFRFPSDDRGYGRRRTERFAEFSPPIWFNFRLVLRTIAAFLTAAGLACAAAPAAEQLRSIAPGVSVPGARVGGLTAQPAGSKIAAAFARRIVIVSGGRRITVSPSHFGAKADVHAAVRSALDATPRSKIGLPVKYSQQAVINYVDRLARKFDRAPRNATVVGANANGPLIRRGKVGVAVQKETMREALAHELTGGSRAPLELLTDPVAPKVQAQRFGPIVVITRGANTLELYDSRRLVRSFRVATGQAVYPTPSGVFRVVDKQLNPWWYPPTYDSWAKGLKPVPPGPGNPLGTRWMALSAPGVGIHGTNSDTSIGYSVSHGCIRMHVSDAEWLFEHVAVNTPVVIL
jgi:lipoprotein-anchoring transpeptidase ErfK/SrfK